MLLNEINFPDRFRNYQIANQVSRDSINSALGDFDLDEILNKRREGTLTSEEQAALDRADIAFNGAEIWLKQIDNVPLTPEEEAAWRRGTRGIGKWQALMEQTGLFRFNPDERRQLREASLEITEELTGVPRDVLMDMRRYGLRWEDVFDTSRGPDLKLALNNLEMYSHFTSGTGLLPSEQRVAQARIRGFWQAVSDTNEELRQGLLDTEKQFERGDVSYRTWERDMEEKVGRLVNVIDDLKKTSVYSGVPVTIQERLEFSEDTGVKIVFHPLEELRSLYYGIELQDVYDEELQDRVADFDRFFLERTAVRSALDPMQRIEFEDFINRNDTPLERLRYEIWQQFIRPYRAVSDIAIEQFTPEEQIIIQRSQRAVGRERSELLGQTTEGGDQIVASYNAIRSQIRDSVRRTDPELEAWLLFFGEIDQPLTLESQTIYDGLISQMRRGGVESLLRDILPVPPRSSDSLDTQPDTMISSPQEAEDG